MDNDCFVEAINDDCRIVDFSLPNPMGDGSLHGRILGPLLGKCEVLISDSETGDSMRCNLDSGAFERISSIGALESVCAGELLDRLL